MRWVAGRRPPPAHTSTRLSMSGPTHGEGRHETCPYEEWRHPHTTPRGWIHAIGALSAGSGVGMTEGGGERWGNEYGDGDRLGVRVSRFLRRETFA